MSSSLISVESDGENGIVDNKRESSRGKEIKRERQEGR